MRAYHLFDWSIFGQRKMPQTIDISDSMKIQRTLTKNSILQAIYAILYLIPDTYLHKHIDLTFISAYFWK